MYVHLRSLSVRYFPSLTFFLQITTAIGDEIRDTSNLTDLNDTFDNTRVRIRGNMTRMLRMAERTGVGWRVWLVFLIAVFLIFAYVWLS